MALMIGALLFWLFMSLLIYRDAKESRAWRAKIQKDIAIDNELIRKIREKL
jgi:hypothetical protein